MLAGDARTDDSKTEESKTDSDTLLGLSPSTSVSDVDTVSVLGLAIGQYSRSVIAADLDTHAHKMAQAFDEALVHGSALTMLPNYSIDPTGNEAGNYLVIDLGGSTLRVAVITIAPPDGRTREERVSVVTSRKWLVENSNKQVDDGFFAWVGSNIRETLALQTAIDPDSEIPTGITWSFPLDSTSYNTANILHMGKGYDIDSSIFGHDLKHVLESSVWKHHHLRINVACIINDSLAVYAASSFLDSNTGMAMVLGTGLNVCCQLTTLLRIHALKRLEAEDHCLFNTETSLFGADLVEPFATKYDVAIDGRFSAKPRFSPHMELDPDGSVIFQPSELLTSGRYLPELVRLTLVEMVERSEVFSGQKNLAALYKPYEGVTGELLCFVHECDDLAVVAAKLESFYSFKPGLVSAADVASVRLLVGAVIRRSAYLVAVAIVAFLRLMASHNGLSRRVVSIGYVGSVMEYFNRMRGMIAAYVNGSACAEELGVTIELQMVKESSVVGAAIGAACHS